MKYIIFLNILAIFLFNGCGDTKKIIPSNKTVKIGVLAPLSGKHTILGSQSVLGLKAAQEINKYLINGDKIAFEIVDTKSDAKKSKQAFLQLIKSDVKVIISFMNSDNMLELKDMFQRYKIPVIATLATHNYITSKGGYVSQVCFDNNTQVLVASHYIRDERLIKNTGIIYESNSDYSFSLATEFKRHFETLGGRVKFFLDVSNLEGIEKFKNTNFNDTEILFNVTNATISTKILTILKKQKQKLKVLGTDGLLSSALELSKANLSLFEGVYAVEHYAHNLKKNQNQKKLEKILKKNHVHKSSNSFLAYDGYKLLIYALQNCNNYEKECINKSLQNTRVIDGILNHFSMIDSKVKREIFVDKISNSQLKKEVVIY